MDFVKKYPFLYLVFTPLIFLFVAPYLVMPGRVLSLVRFNSGCLGEHCTLPPIIFLGILCAIILNYLLALLIYISINKPSSSRLFSNGILLALYFVAFYMCLGLVTLKASVSLKDTNKSGYSSEFLEFQPLLIEYPDASGKVKN